MTPTENPTPEVALYRKLHEVAEAIPYVEKRGVNTHHSYNFAQAVDVLRDVRAQLLQRSIVVLPNVAPGSLKHHTETGGKGFVTTVDFVYRFVDVATGASVELTWAGAGADVGGDKGLYKAMTGGLKYALIGAFLLPMTEDPEHDALTVRQAQGQEAQPEDTKAKDAERPAAPRIPLDRAKAIADAAVAAGLSSWGEDGGLVMEPVLKAYLATVGVVQVGQLDVDQAETVEAFIAAEHAAQHPVDGAA